MATPKKPILGKANTARRNAEAKPLAEGLKAAAKGAGPIKSLAEKRTTTRQAKKAKALKDEM